jgi:hypothetical protein
MSHFHLPHVRAPHIHLSEAAGDGLWLVAALALLFGIALVIQLAFSAL